MRPDLPLILTALGMGVALALFADEGAPEPVAGAPTPGVIEPSAEAPDPVDDFVEDFDPVFVDCFGDVEAATNADQAAGDPEAVVEGVSEQVERLRKLRFREAVDARFLNPDELRAEVEGLVEEELPVAEVRREEQVLQELGAIPPDGDLAEITTEALGSQVAGLYDTKSRQLLVGADPDTPGSGAEDVAGSGSNADELVTLAHELEHALVDQALGLREHAGNRHEMDRELAYAALVEGDATLAMELYALTYIGVEDQLELGESVPGEEEFDALPDYVQRSLLFPYLEGLRFVCHRLVGGGWPAVNRVYEEPPQSTSQVIFPDRYGVIPPEQAGLPPRPGPGWTSVSRRELGAAELEWLFRAPGGDPDVALPETRELVFGWAGGELELWRRGADRALAISLLDLPTTDSLCGAMAAWYRAGWPEATVEPGFGQAELAFAEPGRVAVLACPGREVRLGIAPDRATAAALARHPGG